MTKEIILSKSDYMLLSGFIKNHSSVFSDYTVKKLAVELANAKVVENENVPKDAVGLNSEVKILETGGKKDLNVKLVMPSEANVKESKISIFAPLSAALIGYRKGDTIEWEVPSGTKKFKILDVKN